MNKGTPKGFFALLAGIVIRPRATLRYLHNAKRRWWALLALLMIAALIVQQIAYARADAHYKYRQQLEWFESLPPEERGPTMQPPQLITPPALTVGVRVLGRVVGMIFTWLVWAGVIYLAGVFFGQNSATFGATFALTLWTWVPHGVRNVVQSAAMLVTRNPIYNQGLSGLVMDNVPPSMTSFQRYIIPSMSQRLWGAFLGQIDVYLIWQLGLMVLGVRAFTKLPRVKAILVTVGAWLVIAVLNVLPQLVGGARIF
ncbi:MAG: YIP1 family protein [Anaerolineae bacterium]